MITGYYRPKTLEEALQLLERPGIVTKPMGGGVALSRDDSEMKEVVDLQDLGLNTIKLEGEKVLAGACLTLRGLFDFPNTPPELMACIQQEASINIQNAATVAGILMTADGRSPFATAMLALDANLFWQPGNLKISLEKWFEERSVIKKVKLISQIEFDASAVLGFEMVARSPLDRPMVCAATAKFASGIIRVALGGWGKTPKLVYKGTDIQSAIAAAGQVYPGEGDEWASSEYRQHTATVLVQRLLSN